jgi:hypothetical protein
MMCIASLREHKLAGNIYHDLKNSVVLDICGGAL